mgnify:CR=1 FL=1
MVGTAAAVLTRRRAAALAAVLVALLAWDAGAGVLPELGHRPDVLVVALVVLPLTFAEPTDYDRVQEDDRISLLGLSSLAPGSTHTMVLHHASGKEDRVTVRHTFNAEQIEWFKAGSALNIIRARMQ